MTEPERPTASPDLPDALRDPNRAVVIYQTAPPPAPEPTGNPLYLLGWLAVVSVCVALTALSFWRVWNPGHDPGAFSPVFAEGRPLGLSGLIEERERVNELARGLPDFLERVRSDTLNGAPTFAEHPLITGRDGIDALRREWDAQCRRIRETVYERRIGQIEVRIAETRRLIGLGGQPGERERLETELIMLTARRDAEETSRRTDADPSLRCTPAAVAPACGAEATDPWCNPRAWRPEEFTGPARP